MDNLRSIEEGGEKVEETKNHRNGVRASRKKRRKKPSTRHHRVQLAALMDVSQEVNALLDQLKKSAPNAAAGRPRALWKSARKYSL